MKTYYISRDGSVQEGPFTIDDLKKMRLTKEVLVFSSGMTGWMPISEVPELAGLTGEDVVPPLPNSHKKTKKEKDVFLSLAIALCGLISVIMLFFGLSIIVDPDPYMRPMISGVLRFVYGVAGIVSVYGLFYNKQWGGAGMLITLAFGIFVGLQGCAVMGELGTDDDMLTKFFVFWVVLHLLLMTIIWVNMKRLD